MKNNGYLSNLVPIGLILSIFLGDLYLTENYSFSILYVLPILLLGFWNKIKLILPITSVCLILNLSAFFLTTDGVNYISLSYDLLFSSFILLTSGLILFFLLRNFNVEIKKVDDLSMQALQAIERTEDYSIIFISPKKIIRNWNEGAVAMFGFEKNEVIGQNISILSSGKYEENKKFFELINSLNKVDKNTTKLWLQKKDGSLFWTEVAIKEILDQDDESIGYSVIVQNLDNQRSMEQLIAATNSLAKVGGWDYDISTDKLRWSQTTREIHETEPDYYPTTAEGIKFYLEGEDRERITAMFSRMLETGEPFEEELRIKTAKNNIKWVKTRAYGIMVDGVCKKVYGSFQDIDDLKKKEIELIRSEKQFKNVFNHSANGMARINAEGYILEANRSFYKLVGYNFKEIKEHTIISLMSKKEAQHVRDLFNSLEKGNHNDFTVDIKLYHKSGKLKWVNMAVSKIMLEEGKLDYFIAQLTDITERKEGEIMLLDQQYQLIEKNKELNQYAYITSHDLQEPVRTINSFSSLLNQQYSHIIDETGQKYLRFINEASVRLKNQIKGLLDYSRLSKDDKVSKKADLNSLLKVVLMDLNTLLSEKNAIVNNDPLPSIFIFETEFMLLLQNLISNAVKFVEENKQPVIHISAKEDEFTWEFCVADNGIGMDKKFHDKIFQIFQRLHGKRKYEGSGIGLAHCKKIIELHKGKIWVESELNEGSKFYFTINKNL